MTIRLLKMVLAYFATMAVTVGVVGAICYVRGGPPSSTIVYALPWMLAFVVFVYCKLPEVFLRVAPVAGIRPISEEELAQRLVQVLGAAAQDGTGFEVHREAQRILASLEMTTESGRKKAVFMLTLREGDRAVNALMTWRSSEWSAGFGSLNAGLGISASTERIGAYSTDDLWKRIETVVTCAGWTLRPGYLKPLHRWLITGAAFVVGIALSIAISRHDAASADDVGGSSSYESWRGPDDAPPPTGETPEETKLYETSVAAARASSTEFLHEFLARQRGVSFAHALPLQKNMVRIYLHEYVQREGADHALCRDLRQQLGD